jgi:hypothetical protein
VNQLNSSISSSETGSGLAAGTARKGTALGLGLRWRFKPLLVIIGWTIAGLLAIELLIGALFAYPTDPRAVPSRLQAYFEYGRSAEGALKRMTRSDPAQTAPITLSGWYDPLVATGPGAARQPNAATLAKPLVTIYGGSHSVLLAEALGRVSDTLSWRSIAAPGASSNWSYGAFLRDPEGVKRSTAVVLTFNTKLLPAITSMTPAAWNHDSPMPYTADRFYLQGGQMRVIHPPYESFGQYRQTLADPQAWRAAVEFFATNDPLFNLRSFRSGLLDMSALGRVAQRAYNSDNYRETSRAVLDQTSFNAESEAVQVARAIIAQFAARARAAGAIPVIYIVNDLGYSDTLFRALKPALDANRVLYVSSHEYIPPGDPSGYLPDSHFTDANDDRLALALEALVLNARCGLVASPPGPAGIQSRASVSRETCHDLRSISGKGNSVNQTR